MKKVVYMVLLFTLSMFFCFAQPQSEDLSKKRYVASTSWVSSIAQLAGMDDVVTIAPANLRHPPEYEITPDDVYKIANAELFMHAGYERMMKTISNAAEVDKDKIFKVKTTNTLDNLRNMTNMLSEKAGTQIKAKENFDKIERLYLNARKRIKDSNANIRVFCNSNQAELARDLGLNVVSVFGPGQLASNQIAEAAREKYDLVIDNVHSPVASPIKEVSPKSIIITLRNFPDHAQKDALYNVIKEDLDVLWSTNFF